ncbi:MAG TPA: TIGR04283 family arsenosugar biosynthesis glycosyltransferase [Thermoanaerobaculia bacterium]|nr:TIGR04283 family arsenosugar biosynthesis glycosyltransferase [Thermoanaerobaculia bacterium]
MGHPPLPPAPRISVVVPVLDEERRIGRQLAALVASGAWHEVICVDGGSADGTLAAARAVAGATVLSSPRGRAVQMNRGAAAATGDVLLFLHADVELPADAPERIATALADPAVGGGAFRTWTVPDGRRTWLAPLLHLGDLRSRYSRLPYGDQAIFVRTALFRRLGGFPEIALMEDLAFSRALSREARIRIVPAAVRVSGRRFLARPVYYFLLVNLMPLLVALGVPPERLARLYGNPR